MSWVFYSSTPQTPFAVFSMPKSRVKLQAICSTLPILHTSALYLYLCLDTNEKFQISWKRLTDNF